MTHNTIDKPNTWKAFTYVLVQVVLLLLLIFGDSTFGVQLARVPFVGSVLVWLGLLGIVVSAVSIRTSLTAMPLPKAQGQLATKRLYKFVRHPMYTSVLLFAVGVALRSGSGFKYALVLSLAVLFFYKSVYEERYLRQKYPGYADYAKHTPRFIPFIARSH